MYLRQVNHEDQASSGASIWSEDLNNLLPFDSDDLTADWPQLKEARSSAFERLVDEQGGIER